MVNCSCFLVPAFEMARAQPNEGQRRSFISQRQQTFLKKQNLRHDDYGKKSIEELIPSDALKKASVKLFNYDASLWLSIRALENFRFKITDNGSAFIGNAVQCMDVNRDGFVDLVLGGNLFNFQPQLVVSMGDVLLNDEVSLIYQ